MAIPAHRPVLGQGIERWLGERRGPARGGRGCGGAAGFRVTGVAPAGSALLMARRRRNGPTRTVRLGWVALPLALPRSWGTGDGEGLVAVHTEKQISRAAAAASLTSVQT